MANEKNIEQLEDDASSGTTPEQVLNDDTQVTPEESVSTDDTQPDTQEETPDSEDAVHAQLRLANARADENWERVVRMQAEMDNLRKRQMREIENAHKFALDKISSELLTVRDGLESAINAGTAEDADVAKLQEGSELILKQLTQVMEKFNIVEVDPVGEKFDPDMHQAMSMQEVPDTEPNTVVTVMQKGYTLNERLLRPAVVMVSK